MNHIESIIRTQKAISKMGLSSEPSDCGMKEHFSTITDTQGNIKEQVINIGYFSQEFIDNASKERK